MQSVENLLKDFCLAFYADDFHELVSLEKTISEVIIANPDCCEMVSRSLEFNKFKEDLYYYGQGLSHLRDLDWELVFDLNDIKVEYKYSDADFYTKASVLINSSIFETLSVIGEEDLLPSWYFIIRIHALSQVNVLASPAKFKKLMKYNFWFPWPLTNRECYLEFSAYPVPEDQGILVIMRSPKTSYMELKLPESTSTIERMNVKLGCILIQYISPNLTKVSILVQANANYDQSILPNWLLTFGKKQMMYFLMDSLRIAVMNFRGSEYENRVNKKHEYYDFIRKVLRYDVEIS
jgi:hypothetical protein